MSELIGAAVGSARTEDRSGLPSAGPDFHFFDLLRCLASISVMVSHVRDLVIKDFSGGNAFVKTFYFVTGLGHQAVMLFFVLSGFWISKAVQSRVRRTAWSFTGYLVDRLTRLWVVLVPALILGAALDTLGLRMLSLPLYVNHLGAHSLPRNIGNDLGLGVALGNCLFLQTLLVPTFGSNGPLWSLAREFWYYIWFPGLYFAVRQITGWPRSCLILLFVGVGEAILPGFLCWMMGVLVFSMANKFEMVSAGFARRGFWAALLCLLLVLALSRTSQLAEWMNDDLIGGLTSMLLWFWIRSRMVLPSIVKPLAQFGALSSFSLYVIHLPLALLIVAGAVTTSRWSLGWQSVLMIAAVCLACILASIIFSWLTERRTPVVRAWLRGISQSSALNRWSTGLGMTIETGPKR